MEEKNTQKQVKGNNNLINKTWQRCKSTLTRRSKSTASPRGLGTKSKSWPREGCFTVYVGPERQRFAVKTEHANHPLFRELLEEAESEFGYDDNQGPLTLPCNVPLFYEILLQMDHHFDFDDFSQSSRGGWGLSKRRSHSRAAASHYRLLSPEINY